MTITLREYGKGYGPRTILNAKTSLTIAIAADFTTAGEKLTRKSSSRYVAATLDDSHALILEQIRALTSRGFSGPVPEIINIAGNGIYTWAKHGVEQGDLNLWVKRLVRLICNEIPVCMLTSGGQTGSDQAGAYAAMAIGVPATINLPEGWLYRDVNRVDHTSTRIQTWKRLAS